MLEALAGCAALLLVVAGAAKLRAPQTATRMITTLWPGVGRPVARAGVRVAAAGEVGLGVAVLVVGGRPAALLLAATYLLLLAVSVRVAASRGAVSCGCFGATGGGAASQVALDIACLAVAAWAAIRPGGALLDLLLDGPSAGWIVLVEVGLLSALAVLATVRLPELERLRRELGRAS